MSTSPKNPAAPPPLDPKASSSTSSGTGSGPAPLPPPKRGRGRPPGSRTTTPTKATTAPRSRDVDLEDEDDRAPELRPLPEDPKEFDEAIRACKTLVRPVMAGLSATLQAAGTDPLDDDEYRGGVEAFAALAYQYGAALDARVMVGLWCVGVTMPRITRAFLEARKAKAATGADVDKAGAELREKEVAGKVASITRSPSP